MYLQNYYVVGTVPGDKDENMFRNLDFQLFLPGLVQSPQTSIRSPFLNCHALDKYNGLEIEEARFSICYTSLTNSLFPVPQAL